MEGRAMRAMDGAAMIEAKARAPIRGRHVGAAASRVQAPP